MGEGPTLWESPKSVSCIFEGLAKQQKSASAQGSLKFREKSGKVPGERNSSEESYLLTRYLLRHSEQSMYITN